MKAPKVELVRGALRRGAVDAMSEREESPESRWTAQRCARISSVTSRAPTERGRGRPSASRRVCRLCPRRSLRGTLTEILEQRLTRLETTPRGSVAGVPVYVSNAPRRGLDNGMGDRSQHLGSSRTHLSLAKDAHESRSVQSPSQGRVVEVPRVGGFHHEYLRRAA